VGKNDTKDVDRMAALLKKDLSGPTSESSDCCFSSGEITDDLQQDRMGFRWIRR
jgi:hypothetical protein